MIVARKFRKAQRGGFIRDILSLAPKTPVILILPKKGGPPFWGGCGGARRRSSSRRIWEGTSPVPEKYLFLGHGLLRKMSLEELFDYCFPVITTTDWTCSATP